MLITFPTSVSARPAVRFALCIAIAWLRTMPVGAHDGLHEQIARATAQIRYSPRSAPLYLARAELYRAHDERRRALIDYATALELDPSLDAVHLARGRFYVQTHQPRRAVVDLDRFLERHPDHADASAWRARAHAALSHGTAALADYDRAIAATATPDLILDRARLARRLSPADPDAALAGLNQGIAALGPIPSLVQEALDIEIAAARYDAALERLDRLDGAGQPLWLAARGDILARAGRPTAARDAYLRALTVIAELPPPRQHTRQITRLRTRLERITR